MNDFEDFLQHHGVKGMKWGVIRRRNRKGGADGKVESSGGKKGKASKDNTEPSETARSKLGRKLDSMKREREWNKVLNNMDKMTSKDIKDVTKRIQLENDLKRLSKSKVATTKDKEDYLRRNKMSDDEIKRKVTRLKAKDGLHTQVREASKEQRALGEKLVQIGGSLTIKYTMTKQKPEFKDVYNTIKNPKDSYGNAKSDLQKEAVNRINEAVKKQNKP